MNRVMTAVWVLGVIVGLAQGGEAGPEKLFDGKGLSGWKVAKFGGEGTVAVTNGCLRLGMGAGCTGVTFTNAIPTVNYEVSLEARRVKGNDFFCGMTFPVGKDPCTLIVGGWGGGMVGLSSIDGMDASENETGAWREFENNRWYKIRVRVTDDKILAWVDGKPAAEVEYKHFKISIRMEVEPCKPFGFASWMTTADLRNIQLQRLK